MPVKLIAHASEITHRKAPEGNLYIEILLLINILFASTLAAQTISCGEFVAESISSAGEQDSFNLTGATTGDVITLRMHETSGFLDPHLELRDASDSLVASASGATLTLTLPPTGPFTVHARDDNDSDTGDYELFFERLDGACNATSLPCGSRAPASLPTGTRVQAYTVTGAGSGDVITVRMHETSGFLDPFLELYDGTGNLLAEGAGATLTLAFPSPGPYTLLARDDNYRDPGDYGVSLQRLNGAGACNATGLECGESALGSIATSDETDAYSLTGVASGDLLSLRTQALSGFLDPHVELYDGSGALLGEGSGPTVALSSSGPYTVLSRDDNYRDTGDYHLFPQRFDAPCQATSLALGQAKSGVLTASSQIDTYSLQSIGPQDTITVCMDAISDFGPGIELYDGSGTLLGSDFEFFSGGTATVSATLTAPGPFTVLAMDDGFDETGDYEISLRGAVSSCATTDTEPPTVTTVAPEPGELVSSGSSYVIRWSSADDVGVVSHAIHLSTDGGATFPTVLASGLSGAAQSYSWAVPASLHSTAARIRVIAQDAAGTSGSGDTPGDFLLVDDPPTRTISYTYDSLNRLTGVDYSDGSTIQYVYDEVGNRETMSSTQPVVISTDGFESGDISAWSAATGSVAVSAAAAFAGSFGLRVDVGCPGNGELVVPDGTVDSGLFEGCRSVKADAVRVDPGPVTFRAGRRIQLGDGFSVASGARFLAEIASGLVPDAFVQDDSPVSEERYGARFRMRLDGLALESGDEIELFTGLATGNVPQFRLMLKAGASGSSRQLFLEARQDDGTILSTASNPVTVSAGWHTVELHWRAHTTVAEGRLDLVLDGTPEARLTDLENQSARIDSVRWGASGAGPGSAGFIDLDEFVSQPQ